MKKSLKLFLILFLSITIVGVRRTDAVESSPSPWAESEIAAATEKNLIPLILQTNYQKPIKRFEYALLALELLGKTGKVIQVIHPYPFTDIQGHPYEKEIVIAYNAGLISGYTNGTFGPDSEIIRQEVAVLLVNLIRAMNPDKDVASKQMYTFADSSTIGKWSLDSINYCYTHKFIQGVGKDKMGLDTIAPNKTATIEQSIAMVYRLGVAEGTFNAYNLGTIILTEYEYDIKVTRESNIINEFAVYFGMDLAEEIQKLSLLDNIEINMMSNEYASLTLQGVGHYQISRTDRSISIQGRSVDLNQSAFLNIYRQLLDTLNNTDELDTIVSDSIINIRAEDKNTITSVVGQKDRLTVYKDDQGINDGTIYYDVIYTNSLY